MTAPYEVVRQLSDDAGGSTAAFPFVHVSRPVPLPRFGMRSVWLAVSGPDGAGPPGEWLACGTVDVFRSDTVPGRVSYDDRQMVPAHVRFHLESAITRACEQWGVILAREAETRERLVFLSSCCVAAEGRRRALDREIKGYEDQIRELSGEIPPDGSADPPADPVPWRESRTRGIVRQG